MFASDQVPDGDVLLAAPVLIVEVSPVVVLDAVVSAAFSFFAHAASVSAAIPRNAVLVVALIVMLYFLR
jgi:membrane protein YdbS with pleckstrin-like domain